MEKAPEWLLEFKENVYTQKGEDGIIRKILEILPENDKWCVEFGAWDGIFLSNVKNLIENMDYSTVFIEGSEKRFKDLVKNYENYKNVIALNEFVGFSEQDNLDTILERTPVPKNFDFLSIDVDGLDYHIWKAVSQYTPKLVCIEFNPTIPTEIRFIQEADFSVNHGASLLSLVELAKEKGYELVSVLPFNAFFVRSEYYPLFQVEDNSPANLRKSLEHITYIFSGYDGRLFLHGYKKLPWHGIDMKTSRIQHIPIWLQKHPGNYSFIRKYIFQIFKSPLGILKRNFAKITKKTDIF